jgi:hypothetical protein
VVSESDERSSRRYGRIGIKAEATIAALLGVGYSTIRTRRDAVSEKPFARAQDPKDLRRRVQWSANTCFSLTPMDLMEVFLVESRQEAEGGD